MYNTTTFLAEHPGGDEILLKYSGLDATKPFQQQMHSAYAVSIRDSRLEGKIESPDMPEGHE
ncbi:MAG: cytochrome b5 domain-containing protein [Actinobacteria bacterium]|nr:cytochrome b5 domain-containing protein [Actinomycetota bacterium]